MENHKSQLKIVVFLALIVAIGAVILFLNTNNLQENIKSKLNAKENVSTLSNTLNFSQDKNNTFRYQKIISKGYCGDSICNRENNENKETCCEDCGCTGNLTCNHTICFIPNYSPNHLLYPNYLLNFSIEIPMDWSILKYNNGIAFRGEKNTGAWFNIISVNVLSSDANQTIHEVGVEIAKRREIKEISYENTTLGGTVAEKIVSTHPYSNDSLKQINIIARKGEYFYSLSYTSLTEYFNLSIVEFNHTVNTFTFW